MSNFQTEREFTNFKQDFLKSIFIKAKEYLGSELCMLYGSTIRVERNGCYISLNEKKTKVTKEYIEVELNLQISINLNLDLFNVDYAYNFVVLNDWFRSNYQQKYQYALPVNVDPGTIQTDLQRIRNSVAQNVASAIYKVQIPSFRVLKKSHKKNKNYVLIIDSYAKSNLTLFMSSQEDDIQAELKNGLNCSIEDKACVVRWSFDNPEQIYLRFV